MTEDVKKDIVTSYPYVCSSKSNQNANGPYKKLIKRKTYTCIYRPKYII